MATATATQPITAGGGCHQRGLWHLRGSSGLAMLSCTPAQHTGKLVVLSSVEGAVVIRGTSGLLEWRENAGM